MLDALIFKAQVFMSNVFNPALALASQDAVDTKMQAVMNQVVDIFGTIGKWAGVALIIFGLYQLIMAFRRDSDPEGFINASKWIAIGAILAFALKGVLGALINTLLS